MMHKIMVSCVLPTNIETIGRKTEWFVSTVKDLITNNDTINIEHTDRLVAREMNNMVNESMQCDHRAKKERNRHVHERVPSDWSTIPTLIEDMKMSFGPCSNKDTYLRRNPVTSIIMSNTMALVEAYVRAVYTTGCRHEIIFDHFESMTHLGMIRVLFGIMQKTIAHDQTITLHACLSQDMYTLANSILVEDENMILHGDVDAYTLCQTIGETYPENTTTMVLNSIVSIHDIEGMFRNAQLFVSLTVNLDTVSTMYKVCDLVLRHKLVMEPVLASDPKLNTVRLTNSIVVPQRYANRTIVRSAPEYTIGMLSSYTNRIRPMNLHGMCFDCRMVYSIVDMMLSMTNTRVETGYKSGDDEWTKSFARDITTALDFDD